MLYYVIPIILSYPLIMFLWVCLQVLIEMPGIYHTLKECDVPDTRWNIFKARTLSAFV